MIYLFTDFTYNGPYIGQLKSVIYQINPNIKVIDLMHDAPRHNVKYSAFIFNNLYTRFPVGSIFCCVIDPGVGSDRNAIILKMNEQYFIGPDNGLFEYLYRTNVNVEVYNLKYDTEKLSKTFHGRDLFAPTAAQISNSEFHNFEKVDISSAKRFDWARNLYEIIYIDPFGNLMTGIHIDSITTDSVFNYKGQVVTFVETYSGMTNDMLYWYVNSTNLVEFAMFSKSASLVMSSQVGDIVELSS